MSWFKRDKGDDDKSASSSKGDGAKKDDGDKKSDDPTKDDSGGPAGRGFRGCPPEIHRNKKRGGRRSLTGPKSTHTSSKKS